MRTVFFYLTLIGVSGLAARLFDSIDLNGTLFVIVLAIVLVTCLSNYRFWIGQYFVARMQFKAILRLAVIASFVTVCIMLIGGLLFNSALLVVIAPAIGELILIYAYSRLLVKYSELKNADA